MPFNKHLDEESNLPSPASHAIDDTDLRTMRKLNFTRNKSGLDMTENRRT